MRSGADNVRGWEATTVTNHLKTTLDPILEFDFDSAQLTVPTHSTEEFAIDFWTAGTRGLIHDPDEGWCADPADRGAITNALRTLLDDGLRVRMGAAAARVAAEIDEPSYFAEVTRIMQLAADRRGTPIRV